MIAMMESARRQLRWVYLWTFVYRRGVCVCVCTCVRARAATHPSHTWPKQAR
jgi:hypothetical protein